VLLARPIDGSIRYFLNNLFVGASGEDDALDLCPCHSEERGREWQDAVLCHDTRCPS